MLECVYIPIDVSGEFDCGVHVKRNHKARKSEGCNLNLSVPHIIVTEGAHPLRKQAEQERSAAGVHAEANDDQAHKGGTHGARLFKSRRSSYWKRHNDTLDLSIKFVLRVCSTALCNGAPICAMLLSKLPRCRRLRTKEIYT